MNTIFNSTSPPQAFQIASSNNILEPALKGAYGDRFYIYRFLTLILQTINPDKHTINKATTQKAK